MSSYLGCTSVTGMKLRIRKRQCGSGVVIVTEDFGGDARMCRQIMAFLPHMCSGFPTEKVEQMIVTSQNDVTVICCAIEGGMYIRKASLSLGAVIWVSGTEWLSPLLSHQPSTPATSVPLVEQEYILDELCTLFIHVHVPRPFWEPFS